MESFIEGLSEEEEEEEEKRSLRNKSEETNTMPVASRLRISVLSDVYL